MIREDFYFFYFKLDSNSTIKSPMIFTVTSNWPITNLSTNIIYQLKTLSLDLEHDQTKDIHAALVSVSPLELESSCG